MYVCVYVCMSVYTLATELGFVDVTMYTCVYTHLLLHSINLAT